LPNEFWDANEHGVKGGIELAFMSTTLDRKVAKSFASGTGKDTPSIVFEIQMGMVSISYIGISYSICLCVPYPPTPPALD